MSAESPQLVRFCFRCALPVKVTVRGTVWTIQLGYYSKGRRAELIATSSDGRSGTLADGRVNEVEHKIRTGVLVPVGTIRYRIALALAADGRATIEHSAFETL